MSDCNSELIAEQQANAALMKQQIAAQEANTAQINQMIQESSDALLCGPECQKAKTSASLLSIYEAAQENVKTAPYQLTDARKNYYVYTEGQYEYNIQEDRILHNDAVQRADTLTKKFTDITSNLNTLITNYNISLVSLNNSATLFKDYKGKNLNMVNKLKNINNSTLTNNRKSYYENTKSTSLKKWHTFWLILYYVTIICLIIVLYIKGNLTTTDPSFYKYIALICISAIYPWIISWIIHQINQLFNVIKKYLPNNIYNKL